MTYEEYIALARDSGVYEIISELNRYWDPELEIEDNCRRFADSLCDGEFLACYDWSEEEVNNTYEFLENIIHTGEE